MAKTKPAQQNTESQDENVTTKAAAIGVARKITVKELYGTPKIKDIPDGALLKLCRIAGVANGTQRGESTYGNWAALKGEFAGTNFVTGEVKIAQAAIVPGAFGDMLISTVEAAIKDDPNASLKFCVDIYVKVSARDANKYEYECKPVMETAAKNQALELLSYEV